MIRDIASFSRDRYLTTSEPVTYKSHRRCSLFTAFVYEIVVLIESASIKDSSVSAGMRTHARAFAALIYTNFDKL